MGAAAAVNATAVVHRVVLDSFGRFDDDEDGLCADP